MTSPQPSQRPVAPLPGWTVTHRGRGRRPDKIRSAVADRRPSVCTICFYRIRTTTQGERRHLIDEAPAMRDRSSGQVFCDAVGEVLLARILMYHRRPAHDGTLWPPPDGGTGPLADRCSCCAPTVATYARAGYADGATQRSAAAVRIGREGNGQGLHDVRHDSCGRGCPY